MASLIQNLVQHALGDGARAAKFECEIHFPDIAFFPDNEALSTLVKTATFPGMTHETVDIKYKGRSIPVKGQVKYTQTWDCTFYLTEDHALKNAFEVWLYALDQRHYYNEEIPPIEMEKYTSDVVISQLNFDMDSQTSIYFIYNVFPTVISHVETNYESVGQQQEFTVTFSYSHYMIEIPEKEKDTLAGQLMTGITDKISEGVAKAKKTVSDKVEGAIGPTIKEVKAESQQGLTKMFGKGLI
jgi:hypothetical protein